MLKTRDWFTAHGDDFLAIVLLGAINVVRPAREILLDDLQDRSPTIAIAGMDRSDVLVVRDFAQASNHGVLSVLVRAFIARLKFKVKAKI